MAGDWIKVEKATPSKPEVLAMSAALGIEPDCCFGKLVRVWSWFDDHTVDGNATGNGLSVTPALLDRLVSVTGFGQAMVDVGWLISVGNAVAMPHFDYHTSESAKQRALTAKRVAKHKEKTNATGNATSVTAGVTCALPREEKRRDNTGPAPIRHFASKESTAAIPNAEALSAVRIEPLPRGTITNGQAIKSIPSDIGNCAAVAEWWRRHLSSDSPLTGDTALDLLQVLCLATEAARSGNRVTNKTGWFAKRLADGTWLGSSTNVHQIRDWLNSEINAGRVTLAKQGGAA